MSNAREFRIYISSTIDDLLDERAAAKEIVGSRGRLIDSYRVTEEAHEQKCVDDVRQAHLYIGIIGHRYGWVPRKRADGTPISITECEFEACEQPGQRPIPRLMFVRTVAYEAFDDRESPVPADPVLRQQRRSALERFRSRALETGIKFDKLEDFKLRLQEAVIAARDNFHRADVPGQPLLAQQQDWPSRLKPLALLTVGGADEAVRDQIARGAGEQIDATTLRISDADLAWQAHIGLRDAQLGALLVSDASLKMMDTQQRRGVFARLLVSLRRRTGFAPLLCLDGTEKTLPKTWPVEPEQVLVLDRARLEGDTQAAAADLLRRLRDLVPGLSTQTRLALPTLVIAPTDAEVRAMLQGGSPVFDAIADGDLRHKRRAQLSELADPLKKSDPAWPAGRYHARREDWRCFGPRADSAAAMLARTVRQLNEALPGSREREQLKQAQLLLRPYSLDEYLHDEDGSRRVVEAVCDAGALVLVDELALLHPALRMAAHALLSSARGAVATLNAADPTARQTQELLSELSLLRVGSVLERFDLRRDPQCEVHLVSAMRLERWLRTAIPRLLADLAGLKAQPALVARADEVLV